MGYGPAVVGVCCLPPTTLTGDYPAALMRPELLVLKFCGRETSRGWNLNNLPAAALCWALGTGTGSPGRWGQGGWGHCLLQSCSHPISHAQLVPFPKKVEREREGDFWVEFLQVWPFGFSSICCLGLALGRRPQKSQWCCQQDAPTGLHPPRDGDREDTAPGRGLLERGDGVGVWLVTPPAPKMGP